MGWWRDVSGVSYMGELIKERRERDMESYMCGWWPDCLVERLMLSMLYRLGMLYEHLFGACRYQHMQAVYEKSTVLQRGNFHPSLDHFHDHSCLL